MTERTQFTLDVRDGLSLTEMRPGDASAFVQLLNDEEIYRNTLRIPHPYGPQHADQFLASVADHARTHGHPIHFAIRERDDRLIGGCGFENLTYGHRAELGYWLGRPYWGRGTMTDVVSVLCDYAFDQWKLVRITANVFEFNHASARVLQKCGFQCEGLLRKHHRKGGAFIDSKVYALVR